MKEQEIILLDVKKLGSEIGVPLHEVRPPVRAGMKLPEGMTEPPRIIAQNWSEEWLDRAIAKVAHYKTDYAGRTIAVGADLHVWIVLGIAYSLLPECRIIYAAMKPGSQSEFEYMDFLKLPMGDTLNPELMFDYTMRTEGDCVYIDYCVDDPNSGKMHSFDNARLPELILPRIPENSHVFLHAVGSYVVQTAVANSYGAYAKSVSTAYHDPAEYHCAISHCEEMKPGQTTPRKRFADG